MSGIPSTPAMSASNHSREMEPFFELNFDYNFDFDQPLNLLDLSQQSSGQPDRAAPPTSKFTITDDGEVQERLPHYTNFYNPQGELQRTVFDNGATASATWQNGMLVMLKHSDGFTNKFENGQWNEYDQHGKQTGRHTIRQFLPDGTSRELAGKICAADLLGIPVKEFSAQVDPLMQKKFPSMMSIGTTEATNPIVKDALGRIVETHFGDKSVVKFGYDRGTEKLTSATFENGSKLQLDTYGKWTLTNQSGKRIEEEIAGVTLQETGELLVDWPNGSRFVFELNGDIREVKGAVDPRATVDVTLAMFKQLDLDGNDQLSREELSKAVLNHALRDEEAQVATALFQRFKIVASLNGLDGAGGATNAEGITKADLEELKLLMNAACDREQVEDRIRTWAKSIDGVGRVDSNHDGFVSREEIDKAKLKPANAGESELLNVLSDSLTKSSPGGFPFAPAGFSINELARFGQERKLYTLDPQEMLANFEASVNQAIIQTEQDTASEAQNNPVFRAFRDRGSEKDYMSVRQGPYGDCYLLAPLAAVAATRPDLLRNMVQSNNDGTYTVKFYGHDPIVVSQRTIQQMALGTGGSRSGDFVGIAEDAYGILNKDLIRLNSKQPAFAGHEPLIPLHGVAYGGHSEVPLYYLTGQKYESTSLNDLSIADIRKSLADNLLASKKLPITLAKLKHDELGEGTEFFAAPHAYAIVGYEPAADSITVMNPWGQVRRFTPDELKKHFQLITRSVTTPGM